VPPAVHVLSHPAAYKDGARVLVLRARNKDGAVTLRTISRASFDAATFDQQLEGLLEMIRPGERIYASAGARDVAKAVRLFKERQLAADYDPDVQAFYRDLEGRWLSCLMDTRSQAEKIWLLDCDSAEKTARARTELSALGLGAYEYATKSGTHLVLPAFDKSRLTSETRDLLHDNALMLWAYS